MQASTVAQSSGLSGDRRFWADTHFQGRVCSTNRRVICPFPVFDSRASLWVPTSEQERPLVLSQGTDRAGVDASVPLDRSSSKNVPASRTACTVGIELESGGESS